MYDFGLLQFPEIIFSLSLRASPYTVLLALFPWDEEFPDFPRLG